jgi:parallel beta-helix repeat protein
MMRPSWRPCAIGVVSCIVAAMSPLQIPAARAQDANVADTVHVAPPTGTRDADRGGIVAALEQVRPGGTVQFAAGMYMMGGEIIRLRVPGVTLLGHPEGTVLRGCNPVVRALERDLERGEGGHLIEGNTFRSTSNAVRVHGSWTEPSIIRHNRFRNNWHSVAIYGNTVHLLDNDISALEPEEVPGFGFPWDAVGIGPSMPIKGSAEDTPGSCANNVVAGNRIEGNADGIMIDTGRPGDSCRNNVVRDNTIIVSRVRAPARLVEEWGLSEPTFIGTPIALLNYAEAFRRAGFTWTGRDWSRPAGSGGNAEAVEESFLEGNVIEGNRIVGAEGLGMEILYASGNRIANNTFTTIAPRDPFPGNFFGPRPEMGVPLEWEAANGSGVWLSPGSNGNEIIGNTFEEIAGAAVFLEGARNRVNRRSTSDAVRDLGRDNRVGVGAPPEDPAEEVRARTEEFFTALSDDSPTFVGPLFYAADAVLVLSGGVVLEGLETITREFLRPNVARLRDVRPSRSRLVAGRDTVIWTGAFRARFAPAADTVEAQLSNTWVRQPDGRWLIATSTLELPARGDGTGDAPVRSRFFHADGLRLHALDFGGEGVPLVFMPNRDRTAYTFIDFAPRFTDRARVLAVTSRGSGQSEGEVGGGPGIAALGRDVIALLDALGLQRAVVAHAWGEVLVYLAEQHPERVAGLIFLAGTPQPDLPALWDADTTGMLLMVPRLISSLDGAAPDEGVRALREQWYAARYLRTDQRIDVPALVLTTESETSAAEDRWQGDVQYARRVSAGELSVPDPATRAYFLRLASDEAAQAELQAVHRDLVAPAYRQASERFRRAFGQNLRLIPVESRAFGYGYREAPDLIEPHIRLFLEEVGALERRHRDTIQVAPPTGEQETDRASILAAVDRVLPGGTMQFAPGTYLVGRMISIATPGVTLLAHPDGTTLRGCDAEGFDEVGRGMVATWLGELTPDESRASVDACGIFGLTGGHATVRGFTFESAWSGLILGCCEAGLKAQPTDGGYVIEGNTFRDIINGVRGILWAPEPSIIRDNRFVNTFHAVSAFGSRLHVLDNQLSVPDPARISVIGYPGFAIGLAGGTLPNDEDTAAVPCDGNVIRANRVEGHPDGIVIIALPGATCRHNVIRDNAIVASTPSFDRSKPSGRYFGDDDTAPPIITGVPLSLFAFAGQDGRPGAVMESVVERNRVTGAHGVGIELVRASGNRIANNVITDIRLRERFPGNVVGSVPEWADANGAGIWVSPGSDGNEIVANPLTDVAAAAVVLEGDGNRVVLRSASDVVRDLGSNNQVSVPSAPDTARYTATYALHSASTGVLAHLLSSLTHGSDRIPR